MKGVIIFNEFFGHTCKKTNFYVTLPLLGPAHCKIFLGNQTIFFGDGIVTIEMFEKKMFQIMCHMMGCNDSSG